MSAIITNECKNLLVYKHMLITRTIYKDDSNKRNEIIRKWPEVEEIFKRFNNELYNIKRNFRYGLQGVTLVNCHQKGMILFNRGLPSHVIYIIMLFLEHKRIIGSFNKFMYNSNK